MASLLDELARLLVAAWVKGTFLARVVIAILLIWPLILVGTGFLLTPPVALAVVPIVTIACLLIILLGSKLAIIELGFARFIARVIVPYLLIGLYCSFIPLSKSRGLVPAVALIWYVILFLFLGGRSQWGALAAVALIMFSVAYFPGTLETIQHLSGRTGDPFSFSATSDDSQLATNIKAQMYSDPVTRPAMIQVTARNGIVTLAGTVSSTTVRYKAFRIAEQTPGVSKIIDKMTIAH